MLKWGSHGADAASEASQEGSGLDDVGCVARSPRIIVFFLLCDCLLSFKRAGPDSGVAVDLKRVPVL